MASEHSWDSTRWRDVQYQGRSYFDQSRNPQGHQLSAPTAVNPASQSAILSPYPNNAQWWEGSGRPTEHRASDPTQQPPPHPESYDYRSRPHGHQTPATGANPQHKEHHHSTPDAGNMSQNRHRGSNDSTDTASVQQAPRGQEHLKLAPSHMAAATEFKSYSGSHRPTSTKNNVLPSFASLQEHANRSDDDIDGPEIAPMARRLPCDSCHKLKPMVRDIATMFAELDEQIQLTCHQTMTRSLEFPGANPLMAAQWIMERLRVAKLDIQEFARRSQHPAHSRPVSPSSGVLKRPGEHWERDEAAMKRPRSGDSTSPVNVNASRPLLSPATTAYGTGAASMSSPAPSLQGPAPTGAHMADLQHQVTMKALALESLQTEYSSLLQKLQRERVKNQALEKKSNAANQEVHDLTTRNEELTEQVKLLETQLEECEKKRVAVTADAARDKDQWSRMLEMSTRLQKKNAEDRQKLMDEREELLQRIEAYEADNWQRLAEVRKSMASRIDRSRQSADGKRDASSGGLDSSIDVADLKREVNSLKARNEVLHQALDEIVRQNQNLNERAKDMIERSEEIEGVATRALLSDAAAKPPQAADDTKLIPTFDPPGFKAMIQPTGRPSLPSLASSFPEEVARSPSTHMSSNGHSHSRSNSFGRDATPTSMAPPPRPSPNWQPSYNVQFSPMNGNGQSRQ